MEITITTGSCIRSYDAATGREALQLFFDDVRAEKIALSELGAIGEWTEGEEVYFFRTAPALVRCGLMTYDQLENLFKRADLDFTASEIAEMVEADAWMVRQDSGVDELLTVQ